MANPLANEYNHSYIKQILNLLIEPSPLLQRADQRRQAQFLAALTLIIAPVGLFLTIIQVIVGGQNPLGDMAVNLAIAGSLLGFSSYMLSRGRYYKLAAIMIVGFSSVCTITATLIESNPDRLETTIYLTIPVLLSSILLSTRTTILVTVLQTVIILFIPSSILHISTDAVSGYLSYYLLISLLIVMVTLHRNLLEHERQQELKLSRDEIKSAHDELEERVAKRTVELTALNNQLTQQMSERQQAENALAEERNLLRTVIDNLPDHIFAINRKGDYVLDNIAHRTMIAGSTAEENIVGKYGYSFFDADLAERYRREEQKIMEHGQALFNIEQPHFTADGEKHHYLTSKIPLRDKSGEIIGLVGIARDISERKLAENALAKERNLLRILIDNLPDMIFIMDTQRRYLIDNIAHSRIIAGTTPNDMIGKTIFDFTPREQAEVMDREDQQILESGLSKINQEEHLVGQDGRERWYLTSKIPLRDETGQIMGMVGVARNISDRKRAEEALQAINTTLEQRVAQRTRELSQSNALLHEQIVERMQAETAEREQRVLAESLRESGAAINSTLQLDEVLDLILVSLVRVLPYDAASIMLIENDVAYIVHGRGFDEIGWSTQDILDVRLVIQNHRNLKFMYQTGQPIAIPDTMNSPDWQSVSVSQWIKSYVGAPITVENKVIGFINLDSTQANTFDNSYGEKLLAFANQAGIAIRNANMYEELEARVTERTAELNQERAQLRTIINSLNEGVVGQIYDGDRVAAQYVNSALVDMLGYPAEGWNFKYLKPPYLTPEQFQVRLNTINETLATVGTWKGEGRLQRKDGSEFDASITTNAIFDAERNFVGGVTILRDISQEKVLQEQKSRFVANASHELRTPLTNLMTRLYLLQKQPERLQDHVQVLESVTLRMRQLVEDLLDQSRFERGVIPLVRRDIDLRILVQNVIDVQGMEATMRSIDLSLSLPDIPLIINVDAGRITQVITNLVANAINYTPDGGWVRVAACLEQDETEAKAVITVEDSGIGISAEALPNIFQPFNRSSEFSKGAGLGLSITREIVKMHGGDIQVESQLGIGTKFTVKLALNTVIS